MATVWPLLTPALVPMPQLEAKYGPVLGLVKVLLGVVPNCDAALEIWPPAFVAYNVMVPNLLNLPFLLWGVGAAAPASIVGLALYASSRAAACPYCTAHTCTFAARRGVKHDVIARALETAAGGGSEHASQAERAAIAVGTALGSVPHTLTADHRTALSAHLTPAGVEAVVLGAVMMGFLNKFMDGAGVPLEPTVVNEVLPLLAPSAWSPGRALDTTAPAPVAGAPPPADNLWTKMSVLPLAPGALALDRAWTAGVPDRWPEVGAFLAEVTGHDWPVLGRLKHSPRAVRAIATMLRLNVDASTTVVGLSCKLEAARIFAEAVANPELVAAVGAMAAVGGGAGGSDQGGAKSDEATAALLALARSLAPSPAQITPEVVAACEAARVAPAAIVELIQWLGVLQLVHRLSIYFVAA